MRALAPHLKGLGDLITEIQRRTPVVHIVLNNSRLDFVGIEQEEAGLLPYGTEMVNPDFSRVAQAMGATGIRIDDPADVRDGLAAAVAPRDGPTVDVVVDKHPLSLPAHVPAEAIKGFTHPGIRQRSADR